MSTKSTASPPPQHSRGSCPPLVPEHPISTANALAVGISRGRTRAVGYKRPFPGVVAPVAWGEDVASLAVAYAQKMSLSHCFSHSTAAVLLGMRLPREMQGVAEIHVTGAPTQRAPRGRRVRGHVGNPDVLLLNGLRVTTPVTTWCQLGATHGIDDLVIAADGMLARKSPLATMAELRHAVDCWRGRRGFRNLQEALFLVRERTDSSRETMLRLLIIRAALPEPMINFPVRSRKGSVVAHGDLAYPQFKIVIEYDGDQHRTDPAQYYLDINRLERITREGWQVIRVNRQHMRQPRSVVSRIRNALLDAGSL
jgi:very-short-patch-repair endonuclease